MKPTKLILFVMALFIAGSSYGQKFKVTSGSLQELKGVEKIKITYDYSDLGVGKFEKEEDYIAKKVGEKEEDEAGTGVAWKEHWFSDRSERFEPKFEELFAKYAEKFESGQNVDSDVIMNVHTTFIEAGYNIGISRMPAYTNLTITFTKGGNQVAEVTLFKSPGADAFGYDFDAGYRISESYAKAGKVMAQQLMKATK